MNFGRGGMGWLYKGEKTLYWHWSPNYGWDFKLEGYNECLITYVMAVSSPTSNSCSIITREMNGAVSGASQYGIPVILIIMELRKCRPHVLVALFLFRSGSFHFKRSIC
jgi:hypothetical protein